MKYLDYLKKQGALPDFNDIFEVNIDKSPNSSCNEMADNSPEANFTLPRRFPKGEPGAYIGNQPRFSDFLAEINSTEHRVLDVGCGPGAFRNEINKKAKYIGMDVDQSMNPEVVCDFNKERFPFPDNSIDFVFSESVLEHVMYPFAVMDEIFRVLKSGGRGYIVVPFHYKAHGSPFEFMRYSKAGVHLLLKKFTNIEIYSIGGSMSVLCHIFWNYARLFDRVHIIIGNIYRCGVWIVFKILNKLDRFDPYRIFTRGHVGFFTKSK